MLCPETDIEEARQLAIRFQKALSANLNTSLPQVTYSIGISELCVSSSADDWFIAADKAMYQAK